MKYIDNNKLLKTFNILFLSQAFNIPLRYKLDTFWTIISQARYLEKLEEETLFPDVDMYRNTFKQLREMGVSSDNASNAVGISNGNIDSAIFHLWQI